MDQATYPLNVARAHEKLLRESGETLPDTAGAPTTTTEVGVWEALDRLDEILEDANKCLYCSKEMKPGDSVTVNKDGKIISCQHWNL